MHAAGIVFRRVGGVVSRYGRFNVFGVLMDGGELTERARFIHAEDGHRLALTEIVARFEDGSRAHPCAPQDRGSASVTAAAAASMAPSTARPCFLLIHGFAQDRHAFLHGDIPRDLVARGASVLLGELRGHGRSDAGEPRDWSLSAHLRLDLPALIEGACRVSGASRVHLVGHSMGGMLGYALLDRSSRLLSLTTFASPILIGRARPLVRLAALAASPAVRIGRPAAFPIDRFLKLLAPILASGQHNLSITIARQLTGLANAKAAAPETIERLLSEATPESPRVFIELAEMAMRGRAQIDGIDLATAAERSSLPIAAIWGRWDVFTSRASLAPLEKPRPRGPRLVVEVPDALHVDLMVGRHARALVDALWAFLEPSRAQPEK